MRSAGVGKKGRKDDCSHPIGVAVGTGRIDNNTICWGYSVCDLAHGLARIHVELRGFSDFVRSLDEMVNTIALRPGDRASLQAAVGVIERAIDERASRPPRHPQTNAIARDLKQTRVAALRQRFAGLSPRVDPHSILISRVAGSGAVPETPAGGAGHGDSAGGSEPVDSRRGHRGGPRTRWAMRDGARPWTTWPRRLAEGQTPP